MSKLDSLMVDGPDDIRAAFDDFYRRGWTDGLPVIPPREEYVREMLEVNGVQPDEVIAELAPAGAPATVENIATNAVMAGCRNEYLPVLIAAVRAIADPRFSLLWVQATTNPATPFLVINGPVRHKLDVNCGGGALGPGWRANATIGRAIRLIMLNIGGGKPRETDKAVLGQPGKYTFCLGELEEESPWDPLHVERGFRREESAVTVFGVQGTTSVRTPYLKPESILMVVANAMSAYGTNSYTNSTGNPVVIFAPGHARLFHAAGWSKSRIKEWLFEETRIPLSLLPKEPSQLGPRTPRISDGCKFICQTPEDIMIIVAGSPEPYHMTYVPSAGETRMATQPVGTGN
ncbi:MAG: hypothetical protein HYY79_09210 [Betaproteobacteria bacterium]|nr:hypothetical protein [Betaproteobacteria bacterium]